MASMVPVAADVQERASTRGRAEDGRLARTSGSHQVDALPPWTRCQKDLGITDGDAGKQRWGAG
jgi:hypothetical protein